MALYVSQFAHLPHLIKAITFVLSLCLAFVLLLAPSAPGSFLVWLSFLLTVVLDLAAIAILVFELEEVVFPLCRQISYSMAESMGALLLTILYFISIWMCVNAKTWSGAFSWTVATGVCFLQTIAFAYDFFHYFRSWIKEQREAAHNLSVNLSNPNYGLP